ncbi:uncharacterized protein BO72DRAFT_292435 [Aspergillus fijiensis CBS 313.89]|uniref:Uncharacterized protein n=1 Tax=Aspergillus fijiensis CBS 313.89 TaxID=1448319 RepID=A0A8G1RH46_9EURO|nr:uncharacterized protein BO72DRAFT_292435 [Aspergillus fijiensis CBS 313.89]RAK72053.1 hypothetical protein BO72DRAFT_292435 [Aspergillus fijiensis CBS 313.89]
MHCELTLHSPHGRRADQSSQFTQSTRLLSGDPNCFLSPHSFSSVFPFHLGRNGWQCWRCGSWRLIVPETIERIASLSGLLKSNSASARYPSDVFLFNRRGAKNQLCITEADDRRRSSSKSGTPVSPIASDFSAERKARQGEKKECDRERSTG